MEAAHKIAIGSAHPGWQKFGWLTVLIPREVSGFGNFIRRRVRPGWADADAVPSGALPRGDQRP